MLDQLSKFRSSHTIRAVYSNKRPRLPVLHHDLEGIGHLLVVTLFCGLAKRVRGILCVETACDIVKLRSGEDAKVLVLGSCGLETIL